MSSQVKALIIGDPHFKVKTMEDGRMFTERCWVMAERTEPDFIVVLGDTLDKHEMVHVQPHKLAVKFIEGLAQFAPVYLLIGNHDLINQTQFLTDNHIFNPLKKWDGVTVVDNVVYSNIKDKEFVFCPYVYPGRFKEALDTLTASGEMWETADCIFAHQEFKGCRMGSIVSTDGDDWDEDLPPVISGHIHDAQTLEDVNVYYPGTPYQHTFGESSDKGIWLATFDDEGFDFEVINLKLPLKKTLYMTVSEAYKLDPVEAMKGPRGEECKLRLYLKGTNEEFKIFRKSGEYFRFTKFGIKIVNAVEEVNTQEFKEKYGGMTKYGYREILGSLVGKEGNDEIERVYEEVVGDSLIKIEEGDEILEDVENTPELQFDFEDSESDNEGVVEESNDEVVADDNKVVEDKAIVNDEVAVEYEYYSDAGDEESLVEFM